MIGRIWVVLALSSLLSACTFTTRDIPLTCIPNDGLGPCNEGETCLLEDGVLRCQCGLTVVEGESACGDAQVCANGDRCNTPPVARIGDGSGLVEVGADSEVFLSSLGSDDPDGDPLLFSWSIEGNCIAAGETSAAPDLRFVVGAAGTKCDVSLTADDGLSSHTVNAEVAVVEVGAYVHATDPNCAVVDDSGFLGNGSMTVPWCTISDGLRAATEYGLTEVRVAADDYSEPGLVIPANVTVIGGFLPQNGWSQGGGRSNLALAVSAQRVVDPRGVALVGDGAGLIGFNIDRAEPCTSDCAVVTVHGDATRIESCQLSTGIVAADLPGAPGFEHVSLNVASQGGPLYVEVSASTIQIVDEASVAYGIRLDGSRGAVSGDLVNVGVSTNAVPAPQPGGVDTVIGIAMRNTTDLVLDGVTVTLSHPDASTVIGILDGNSPILLPGQCSGAAFCDGSTGLDLLGIFSIVTTDADAGRAVGTALLGTAQSYVGPNAATTASGFTFQAGATAAAIGLLTVGTDGLTLDGGDSASSTVVGYGYAGTSGVAKLGVGWVDGWDGRSIDVDAPFNFGSAGLAISNVSLTGHVSADGTEAVSGAILIGTDGAVLDGLVLDAVSMGRPKQASALWTLATRDVEVHNSGTESSPGWRYETIASELAVGFLDGFYRPGGAPTPGLGSSGLTIQGSTWDRALSIEPDPSGGVAACMLLVGTYGGSWVGGPDPNQANTIDCGMWSGSLTGGLTQVWTLGVQEVVLYGNHIGPIGPPLGGDLRGTNRWTGLRDGDAVAEAQFGVALGADKLQVGGNWITGPIDQITEEFVGIVIDRDPDVGGGGGDGAVWIKNNAIRGSAEMLTVGAWIGHAQVEVVNNTVHTGWCDRSLGSCIASYRSVPLYIEGDSQPVEVANNILASDTATHVTLVLDRGGSTATGQVVLSLAAFASNILMPPADTTSTNLTHLCVGGAGQGPYISNSDCFGATGGGGNAGDIDGALSTLSDNGGTLFTSSVDSVSLCSDGVHLSLAAPAANAADTSFHPDVDIDGEQRAQNHDIGADEVTLDQPICP